MFCGEIYIGLAGGMVVFWNDQLSLSVENHSAHVIDMICTNAPGGIPMRLTCLHAPTVYKQRQQLWVDLRQLSNLNTLPWVCIGDFNEIIYHWEKKRVGMKKVGRRLAKPYWLYGLQES